MNAIFDNRIAYDKEFGGFGIADEGARLGQALGDKEVLMMGGHGYVTCGPSIAIAFNRAYFLERVVMFQVGESLISKSVQRVMWLLSLGPLLTTYDCI